MIDRNACLMRDRADPLAFVRARFNIPKGVIYLDGNSLGVMPAAAPARVKEATEQQWGDRLIRSWAEGWADLPKRVGDKIARLIGAEENEVMAADSTSVNLFKMLNAALKMRADRKVILTEPGNFPTCLYAAEGAVELLANGAALRFVEADKIIEAIDESVAVVMLTHINFRSSAMHDLAAITAAAHAKGAMVLWDLAHSAGSVPLDMKAAKVDFAVGCGYKYLNGGPGAPGYFYVRRDLQNQVFPSVRGWWAHTDPLDFAKEFTPADGLRRNLSGTPPILSMTALDAALDAWDGVDIADVRKKSISLTETFIALVEKECAGLGLTLATPRDPSLRGSHVSLHHDHGYQVSKAMTARGVIGDFRTPNLLRYGFAPLYLSHADVFDAVAHLADILRNEVWREPRFERPRAAGWR